MATVSDQTELPSLSDQQLVYLFGDERADGHDGMRELLGGKGAGLAEMSRLGIPVPPGFTITTEVCNTFFKLGHRYPEQLEPEIRSNVTEVEKIAGSKFGDADNPLLLSVRSGARVSMPGMMDTVLNLGLNDTTVQGLARHSGNPRFAYDSYRRFIAMYGDVVLGMKRDEETDQDPFESMLEAKKGKRGIQFDTELTVEDLQELVIEYRTEIKRVLGVTFPDNPWDQLWGAIGAVFESWETPRAIVYRDMYGYSSDWGTAVTVQSMVFGNLGKDCATGVVFTRNAATGERKLSGEYLIDAQGEDVVAGIRTPQPILESDADEDVGSSLEETMPQAYTDLEEACSRLEQHFGDMQDIEFTVQQGRLWILQTRNGKRTGQAMVKIAVDLVDEDVIDERTAVLRQDPEQLNELFHPIFDPGAPRQVIARGLAASPGAGVGRVVFSADEAAERVNDGEVVILVRAETSPEDIEGMIAAEGILTARGGMTSHAAVVARGMGKCCVTGCESLEINYEQGQFRVKTTDGEDVVVQRGDLISLDGGTGEVMLGQLPLLDPELPDEYERLMGWADSSRSLNVRANSDTPEDSIRAREFGAEGIGLCRSEHMFFGEDRILAMRRMICAEDESERRAALSDILPMQRQDFIGIMNAMAGLPVTIRLLDPPLHEFLPTSDEEIHGVAQALNVPLERVQRRVSALHEFNPMLGHRGVRLAVTYPEIYEVQVRAIMEAACDLTAQGIEVMPEIMIPLVAVEEELHLLRNLVVETAEAVIRERNYQDHDSPVQYSVGTMIELPRACVVADRLAEHADFFSFGTNDLTQTTFGLSRDDAGRFLPSYIDQGVLDKDPFVEVDRDGVGSLIRIGVERGRDTKPGLKIGICGEHGGDPESVAFCHEVGFDYVSCSPYRVPIARLAAAQAALQAPQV